MRLRGSPILRIAQGLFGQMRAFGVLANHSSRSFEVLNSEIINRLGFLKLLLQVLEHLDPETSRQLIASGDPIIYNTSEWPPSAQPAGSFEPEGNVSLEQHLSSWYMSWNLQSDEHPESAMVGKVLRAALWLVNGPGGINAAIQYIIDLQVKGVLLNRRVSIHAMIVLLRARRRVQSDSDLAGFFLEEVPSSMSSWSRVQFKEWDDAAPTVRPDLIDDLSALLDRAEMEVDQVLKANSYDAWLLGQLALHPVLSIVASTIHAFEAENELLFVSKLTRLEEIRADAGALGRMYRFGSGRFISFKYKADFTASEVVCRMLNRQITDWRDRVLDDRAVIPDCLQDLVTENGITTVNLPIGWQRISGTLAPIVGPMLLEDGYHLFARTELFQQGQVQGAPGLAALLQSMNALGNEEVKDAIIQILCMQFSSKKNQQAVLDAPSKGATDIGDLGTVLGKFFKERESLGGVGGDSVPKEAVDLFRSAGNFDPSQAHEALRDLYHSICMDEIDDLVNQAFEARNNLAAVDRLCALYPYFHPGQVERAVRLDIDGDTSSALECLVAAIIMEPREATRWHSLGVILRKLGRDDDSKLAYVLAEAIQKDAERNAVRP
jgi:hypothetical protein